VGGFKDICEKMGDKIYKEKVNGSTNLLEEEGDGLLKNKPAKEDWRDRGRRLRNKDERRGRDSGEFNHQEV